MNYGLCAPLEHLDLVKRLGFDYIECSVSSIAAYSDGEFGKILATLTAGSPRVERVNVLFPQTINLNEGAMLEAAVGLDTVGLLADLYHMTRHRPWRFCVPWGDKPTLFW